MAKLGEKASPAEAAAGAQNLHGFPEKATAPLATKHSLRTIGAKVKIRGLNAIDNRTLACRALIEWRDSLLADLGAEGEVSAQRQALLRSGGSSTNGRLLLAISALSFRSGAGRRRWFRRSWATRHPHR